MITRRQTDSSYIRRAETAPRLHKSAPQIFAATRTYIRAVDLSRPFNGSETRHKADPRRGSSSFTRSPRKEKLPLPLPLSLSESRPRFPTLGKASQGRRRRRTSKLNSGLSARTAQISRSNKLPRTICRERGGRGGGDFAAPIVRRPYGIRRLEETRWSRRSM